jgi:hypothetical protein
VVPDYTNLEWAGYSLRMSVSAVDKSGKMILQKYALREKVLDGWGDVGSDLIIEFSKMIPR